MGRGGKREKGKGKRRAERERRGGEGAPLSENSGHATVGAPKEVMVAHHVFFRVKDNMDSLGVSQNDAQFSNKWRRRIERAVG